MCQSVLIVRSTVWGLLWLLTPLSHAALLDKPLAIPGGTAN